MNCPICKKEIEWSDIYGDVSGEGDIEIIGVETDCPRCGFYILADGVPTFYGLKVVM